MKKVYTGVHGREAAMEVARTALASNKYHVEILKQRVGKEGAAECKSFVQEIINAEHVKRAVADFDKALADMTRKTLEAKGFTFESEGDFKLFCRDRLTVVSFEENEFRKGMYLDCISPDEPGTFLFKFSTEITTKYENGVLTTTFG